MERQLRTEISQPSHLCLSMLIYASKIIMICMGPLKASP